MGFEYAPCTPSVLPGIVGLGMRDDYRIDIDTILERHPFAREILDRLAADGYEAVLLGAVVLQERRANVV